MVASEIAAAITTEMASQSQGIQQLLQAEKRAAEKVADARKSESPFLSLRSLERKLGDSKHLSPYENPRLVGRELGAGVAD